MIWLSRKAPTACTDDTRDVKRDVRYSRREVGAADGAVVGDDVDGAEVGETVLYVGAAVLKVGLAVGAVLTTELGASVGDEVLMVGAAVGGKVEGAAVGT